MVESFEGFCELARDADGAVGRDFGEDFEGGGKTMGGLEKEGGFE